MTDDYYGFAEQPFSLTPDPRFFFRSESHEKALDELLRAIERREGFMLLTGDIGTGKTTLCRTLLDQLDRKTFTALVLNPFVSEEELLKVVLQDFGVVSRDDVRRGALVGASTQELVDVLNQFLLSLAGIKASAVLVIDEAQNLPPATLEQVRVLTNLETDRQKLLQIVLVGQLNLRAVLTAPDMRQLNQRISRRCLLQPLARQETEAYIAHRLWVARGTLTVQFPKKTLDLIHQLTGGVPRVINLLCDRVLEGGQAAGVTRLAPALVHHAAEQLALEPPRRRQSDRRNHRLTRLALRLAAAAVAVAAVLAGAWQVVRYYDVPLWPSAPVRFSAGAPGTATPATPDAAPPDAGANDPASAVPVRSATYSILVGAFGTKADAEGAAAALKAQGYLVREIVQTEGKDDYRVLVGRYDDLALARQHAERLQQDPQFKDATIVTER